MKIKGSAKNLKISSVLVVAGIGTLAAVALRVVQAFGGLIDFETGFYTEDNFTIPALYGVLLLSAVLTFVISFFAGEVPQDKLPEKKNIPVAVTSLAFAVTLCISAASRFEAYNALANSYNFMMTEQSQFSYLMKSGAIATLGESVFAVLSGVYFLLLAIKFIGAGKLNLSKVKFFSLCPLFWATFRMVQRFSRTISFMNVSSLFFELFMIAFMMMFFMYLAQTSSQVSNRAISFKVVSYGLIAAMFSAVITVPKVLLLLVDSSYKNLMNTGALECPLEIADFFFLLFAFSFVICLVKSPKIRNMTLKETEKLLEQEEN